MKNGKILVVDDDGEIRMVIKTILESSGYNVTQAKDGRECLDRLENERFDLALVDFFMPIMSGRELVERIRADKKLKYLKVAFLTSATLSKAGLEEFKKMNVLDCITKPFDNEDFIKRVKKII